jgi:hypothetical protein
MITTTSAEIRKMVTFRSSFTVLSLTHPTHIEPGPRCLPSNQELNREAGGRAHCRKPLGHGRKERRTLAVVPTV